MIRRLYAWVIHWAGHPQAPTALFWIAMIESSVFPIPPDFLLIPMVLAHPQNAWRFALICTVGSVIGGAVGYGIGIALWQYIGAPILQLYGLLGRYDEVAALFRQYDVWIVAIAGFSPIPYKLFTITAGAMGSNFIAFMVTSWFARGARFFMVAGILRWGGARLRQYIENHLELLTALLTILVVLGILALKWIQ